MSWSGQSYGQQSLNYKGNILTEDSLRTFQLAPYRHYCRFASITHAVFDNSSSTATEITLVLISELQN